MHVKWIVLIVDKLVNIPNSVQWTFHIDKIYHYEQIRVRSIIIENNMSFDVGCHRMDLLQTDFTWTCSTPVPVATSSVKLVLV